MRCMKCNAFLEVTTVEEERTYYKCRRCRAWYVWALLGDADTPSNTPQPVTLNAEGA